jgi:hypothetical protein
MARPARRPGWQAQVAGLLVISACASVGAPPGGPPDSLPPHIVAVHPDSGAIVPNFKGDAVIQYDEVIEEMAGGGGAGTGGLERLVILSPVAGPVRVGWHRTSISVKPREGWKRRVYRLEVLPGIYDLRRNHQDTAKLVLFSTGPEFGHARIGGIVLHLIDQRYVPRALIEAVPVPDSVGYLTLADSGGQFNLQGVPPGRYIVYATQDDNGDRRRSPKEAYDSTMVTVDSSTNVALYLFPHDSTPPRPRQATFVDSITVRVDFSQSLDPTQSFDTAHVHVLELPDSTPVPIAAILTAHVFDSLMTVERLKRDSAAAAARDTGAVKRPAPPPPPPPPPPAQERGKKPAGPPVDTALVRRLLARRPIPSDKIVIRMAKPLKIESRYVVRIQDATNLIGKKGEGQVAFLVPKPAPVDTTHRAPSPRAPRRP